MNSFGKGPRELYEMMYQGKVSSEDLRNLRIGESSQVPRKVVSYLKRRLDGAAIRVANHKKTLGKCTRQIRERSTLRLSQSEVESIKAMKYRVQAELLEAQGEYRMFEQFYEEALESVSKPFKQKIAASKEDSYTERMAPLRTRQALSLLTSASENGLADKVDLLKHSVNGSREEFRQKFVELIQALDGKLHQEFVDRPKLLTKVIGRVANHFQSTKE